VGRKRKSRESGQVRQQTNATFNNSTQKRKEKKKRKKKRKEEEGRSRAETEPEIARRVFLAA